MNGFPKVLYKYKSLNSMEELSRIADIIDQHHIYMPKYDQLNDPLEGNMIVYRYDPWSGCSMFPAADEENYIVTDAKKDFRILSFTSVCNNPSQYHQLRWWFELALPGHCCVSA